MSRNLASYFHFRTAQVVGQAVPDRNFTRPKVPGAFARDTAAVANEPRLEKKKSRNQS